MLRSGLLKAARYCGIAVLFASHSLFAATVDEQLAKADALRTSDVAQFAQLINQLDTEKGEFTPFQRDYFTYLQTFLISLSGKFTEGIAQYQQLINTTQFDDIRYRALYSIINNYAVNRDFYNGSVYMERLSAMRDSIDDSALLAQGDLTVGLFYTASGQYQLGYEQADLLLSRQLKPRNECLARHMKVEAFVLDTSLSVDEPFMDDAIAFCSSHGELLYAAFVTSNKVRHLIDSKRLDQAQQTLTTISDAVIASQYSRIMAQYYQLDAEIAFGLGNIDTARRSAQLALQHSETAKFNEPAIHAYFILHKIEDQLGNADLALQHYIDYAETDKARLDELKLRNIAIQQAQHEFIVSRQQLDLANNQNQLLQAEAAVNRASAQTQLTALLFMAALIVVGLVWMIRSHRTQLELKRLAQTDGLTELKNRRQLYLEADTFLTQNAKPNVVASFIIFDLDFFKKINDQYGHVVGDWTLKTVASTVRDIVRQNDVLGRLGGEEFGVFLPNCSQQDAKELAEHLRKAIEAIDTSPSGHKFKVSASFGIAEAQVSHLEDFDALFSQSDTALYESKARGRNRVYCFSELARP